MARGLGPSQRRTHKCPAPPCAVQVRYDQLACRGHWYALPKAMRDEIWQTWRQPGHSGRHAELVAEAAAYLRERYPE